MKRDIYIIAHDIRSAHNVGSLLRTADAMGVMHVYFTGYTPYPKEENDERLPHIAKKLSQQINKTALGAEIHQSWSHENDIDALIDLLKKDNIELIALEQSKASTPLHAFVTPDKVALLIGREVEGIDQKLLNKCDKIIEIPMLGKKESLNVTQATAMALHYCRFCS